MKYNREYHVSFQLISLTVSYSQTVPKKTRNDKKDPCTSTDKFLPVSQVGLQTTVTSESSILFLSVVTRIITVLYQGFPRDATYVFIGFLDFP